MGSKSTTDAAGGSILLLGVRHDESKTRSKSIQRHGSERLNPHKVTPGCWVFRPIQHLTTSEVWAYLLQRRPPWGGSHRELVTLYRNAMGGECPFVTDESDAPSCGNNPSSRFGCWTCTVVDKDKSLEGFVAAGFEHLEPLVEFRNWIKALSDDYSRRETQRRDASEGIGPFTIATRKEILARLLAVQKELGVPLITESELLAIHNLWSEDTLFRATGVINQLRTAEGLPLVTMRRGKTEREVTGLPPTKRKVRA